MDNKENMNLKRHSFGLRANYLSFTEVLAQSIASIAPCAMPIAVLPLVFASAGNGSWLTYGLATISIGFVCLSLNQFTRRSSASGSLYGYIALGLGQPAGFLAGWVLLFSYTLAGVVPASGFVNYAYLLLALLGVQVPPFGLYVLVISIAWAVAYRDIKLSAVLLMVIEAISVGLILLLALVVLLQHPLIDVPQLSLQNTSFSGVGLGMVLAILSFVGFESAATLGDEAKQPLHTIPQAIMGSAIATGLFFTGMAYIVVLGFRSAGTSLAQSDAPLSVLADQAGISSVGTLIAIGVTIAGFAGTLASINAAARILYSLAQQNFFPRFLGRTHAQNDTPHLAVSFVSAIVWVISAALVSLSVRPLDILGYAGALLTYGFLVIYLLLTIAAPVYLRRLGQLRRRDILTSGVAGITMLIPLASSLYPVPPAPYHLFPYLLVLWLIGGVGFWRLRGRKIVQ